MAERDVEQTGEVFAQQQEQAADEQAGGDGEDSEEADLPAAPQVDVSLSQKEQDNAQQAQRPPRRAVRGGSSRTSCR